MLNAGISERSIKNLTVSANKSSTVMYPFIYFLSEDLPTVRAMASFDVLTMITPT